MSEPLSRLKPPDVSSVKASSEEDAAYTYPTAAPGEKREWVIVDYDPSKMPGGEVFLPGLWKRMHDDGTFGMFFHEGPDMSFVQFGALLTRTDARIQLVIGHDAEGNAKEHAGLLILD